MSNKKPRTQKVWQLHFVPGNPGIFHKENTMPGTRRAEALTMAKEMLENNPTWRIWVEHIETGETIFQSESEALYRKDGYFIDEGGAIRSVNLPPPQVEYKIDDGIVLAISTESEEREIIGEYEYHEQYPADLSQHERRSNNRPRL